MESNVVPNRTLYVRNLNEKIRKEELRRLLYCCFNSYGRIIEVVALKTMKMRGQAFIVFQDIPNATFAMKSLQGFSFLGKPIIEFASTLCRSDPDYSIANAGRARKKFKSDDALPSETSETEEQEEG